MGSTDRPLELAPIALKAVNVVDDTPFLLAEKRYMAKNHFCNDVRDFSNGVSTQG
jgi:hypothetical protein